ncbi:MAG: FitA-like ribbon-helix-helix domain-containing protein [Armatimonadota bacterium]
MPNLLLRDVPEQVFDKLKKRANREHRSVPAETIHLLSEALALDELREKHREAMRSILERTKDKRPLPVDSLTLLREDRDR